MSDDFTPTSRYEVPTPAILARTQASFQLARRPAKKITTTRNTLWASHRLKEMEPEASTDALIQVTGAGNRCLKK